MVACLPSNYQVLSSNSSTTKKKKSFVLCRVRVIQSQPWQIVCETLSQKNPSQKRVGGVAQGEGPEFKPQYHKKKTTKKKNKSMLWKTKTDRGTILD
jgi:hypothetical protein